MTDEYVKIVCKPGQRDMTCKYLATNETGWVCGKMMPTVKRYIEAQTNMSAKSDNCSGDPDFWPAVITENVC